MVDVNLSLIKRMLQRFRNSSEIRQDLYFLRALYHSMKPIPSRKGVVLGKFKQFLMDFQNYAYHNQIQKQNKYAEGEPTEKHIAPLKLTDLSSVNLPRFPPRGSIIKKLELTRVERVTVEGGILLSECLEGLTFNKVNLENVFHNGISCYLPSLQVLTICQCYSDLKGFPSYISPSNFPNLTHLFFMGNNMTIFYTDILYNFQKIRHINVSGNKIRFFDREINNAFFKYYFEQGREPIELHVRNNELSHYPFPYQFSFKQRGKEKKEEQIKVFYSEDCFGAEYLEVYNNVAQYLNYLKDLKFKRFKELTTFFSLDLTVIVNMQKIGLIDTDIFYLIDNYFEFLFFLFKQNLEVLESLLRNPKGLGLYGILERKIKAYQSNKNELAKNQQQFLAIVTEKPMEISLDQIPKESKEEDTGFSLML